MRSFYQNKTVLVTGHTGFKGSWLALWLKELGANVIGFSLPPEKDRSHFKAIALDQRITSYFGDLRDERALHTLFQKHSIDLVFHLAAQPLVLRSYIDPVETFSTNVTGAMNLLEVVRKHPVQALLFITTDKVYENREWNWGYRESDPLGGDDPYSASKAMGELLAASYRASFFKGKPLLSTARAGNVIGGGDFSDNRLLPDIAQSILRQEKVSLRNPQSTRPWLYVLEPLYGYLLLMQKMVEGHVAEGAFNFGPKERTGITVEEVVKKALSCLGEGSYVVQTGVSPPPEKKLLQINWDKAALELGWAPKTDWQEAVQRTTEWYRYFANHSNNTNAMVDYALKEIGDYS